MLHQTVLGTWVIPIGCTNPRSAEMRSVPVHHGLSKISHGTTHQSIGTFLLLQIYELLINSPNFLFKKLGFYDISIPQQVTDVKITLSHLILCILTFKNPMQQSSILKPTVAGHSNY